MTCSTRASSSKALAPPNVPGDRTWLRHLLVWVLVVVAYRLAVLVLKGIPLFYDEAYYYYWSLAPDWGYFSKPPMVAWLISLTTMFGTTDWLVKLSAPLLYGASALLVGAIARRLFPARVAFWSGVSFLLMPVVSFNSLFMTTDAPLLFFWSLTLYLFLLALDSGKMWHWVLAGLSCGLGLMSKYTMIMLPFGLMVFLALTPAFRALLWSGRFWAAAGMALIVFLPNLWWNYSNDFISFQHTREISQLDRGLWHPEHFLEFFAAQFGVFGPVFMVVFLYGVTRKAFWQDPKTRLLLCLAVPFFLLICFQSLLARANANWGAPVYVTATILVVHSLLSQRLFRWLIFGLAIHVTMAVGLYHYHAFQQVFGVEPSRKNDPYRRILGWAELGHQLAPVRARYPDAWLLSDARKLLAYIGYNAKPRFGTAVATWNPGSRIGNQYDLKANIADLVGHALPADQGFVWVSEQPLDAHRLTRFETYKPEGVLRAPVYRDFERVLYVYYVKGFKGYKE